MADRIKGITVEIGGDTTGLSKALSGVNKEIKSTQTQLKDVNKLLKLDPTNTTLLQQKQQLLKTAISETKDKLTQLKSVQDQMDEGLKNGTVTQQQYDAWQREIVETENELKNLQKELDNSSTAMTKMTAAGGETPVRRRYHFRCGKENAPRDGGHHGSRNGCRHDRCKLRDRYEPGAGNDGHYQGLHVRG